MYKIPDLQYSQLVIAASKAETETLGSNVSEVRVKSAVVEIDSNLRGPVLIHLMKQLHNKLCI